MTLLSGIHHVAIIASDYPRPRGFYTRILGLEVIAEPFRAQRDSWKLDLRLPDDSQLELFSFPAPPKRPSRPEARGLRHLAFRVSALDESSPTCRPKALPASRSAGTSTPGDDSPSSPALTICH